MRPQSLRPLLQPRSGAGKGRPSVAWIEWIDERDATGLLRELYEQYRGRAGIDHILKIHSLNPESMRGHYQYYHHIMHGPSGLSRAEREMIAVVVSAVNHCRY